MTQVRKAIEKSAVAEKLQLCGNKNNVQTKVLYTLEAPAGKITANSCCLFSGGWQIPKKSQQAAHIALKGKKRLSNL